MTTITEEHKNVIYGLYCVCENCKDKPELIRYVGQTFRGASVRFYYHRCDALAENYKKKSNLPVYRWMRKHGVDNIQYMVLEVLTTREELNDAEVLWIEKLNTFRSDYGLNLSAGGSSLTGYKHSEETRAKLRGRVHTEETRKKMSDSWRRVGLTEARKDAMRLNGLRRSGENASNVKLSEYQVIQIKLELWNGVPPSLVANKFNISRNMVNHINNNRSWKHVPWPIGPRQKMRTTELRSQRASGRKHSEETKQKIRQNVKAAKNKPPVLP